MGHKTLFFETSCGTMLRSLLLLLSLLLTAGVSAIETHMGRRNDPFHSPLGYNSLHVMGRKDRKMISNRRKADKIVDAKMAKAEEIKAHQKPKSWGVAPAEKGQDGELDHKPCTLVNSRSYTSNSY
jgi:hypothetical protein